MIGFEINLGVAAYQTASMLAGYLMVFLCIWAVWGLYKDRKGIGAEMERLEKSDDHTLVDLIGFKSIKRTIWKIILVSVIAVFFKAGIVKLVEADETVKAREAMTYIQEVKRERVAVKSNEEIKAEIENRKVIARQKLEKERAESLEVIKAKNKEIVKDSFEPKQ